MSLSGSKLALHSTRRGRPSSGAALASYALIAFLYFGLRLLLRSGHTYLGYLSDPKAFIWAFGWWPHAILHGENPFVTHALWAPQGLNLIWAASVPGLSLLFSPLTLLAGPVVSYNTATTLLPAFAAWSGFLLCRHLTNAAWPSFVGGYLFGFSSYELGQEEGHPNITAVFLVPLIALVVVRFIEGQLSARGLVLRLGPLFGFEFLISTEVTFTLALALLVGLGLAAVLVPASRGRIVALLAPLLASALLAVLLTAPFVYYALSDLHRGAFHPPAAFVADLWNYAIPTKLALASIGWAGSIANHFPANNSERDAYLGVPTLLVVLLYGWRGVRSAGGRFLLIALLLAVTLSLGARLSLGGHPSVSMPWSLVGGLPLFNNVLTARLTMYVSLLAAVIVALWAASRRHGVAYWLLPTLAIAAILPNPAADVWASTYTVPPFFTAAAYRPCLAPDETVLVLPTQLGGDGTLWQALDRYAFNMSGGSITPQPPPVFLAPEWIARIAEGYSVPRSESWWFSIYARVEKVTSVVVDAPLAARWSAALDRIATPHRLGGVVLYRLARAGSPVAQAEGAIGVDGCLAQRR